MQLDLSRYHQLKGFAAARILPLSRRHYVLAAITGTALALYSLCALVIIAQEILSRFSHSASYTSQWGRSCRSPIPPPQTHHLQRLLDAVHNGNADTGFRGSSVPALLLGGELAIRRLDLEPADRVEAYQVRRAGLGAVNEALSPVVDSWDDAALNANRPAVYAGKSGAD
jgi:hypothetical protein